MPKSKSQSIIEAIKSLVGTDERNKVYAILDAARKKEFYHIFDPDKHRDNAYIFEQIHREKWYPELPWFKEYRRCIYPLKGEIPEILLKATPYLARIDLNSSFCRWLFSECWGDNCGIFFISQASEKKLFHHFKKALLARSESGESLYFRYYDPRVFKNYLPSCTPDQLKIFFKLAEMFIVEHEGGKSLGVYRFSDFKLNVSVNSCSKELAFSDSNSTDQSF
jgi:hypothetical protein